jgi:hypothetical protein
MDFEGHMSHDQTSLHVTTMLHSRILIPQPYQISRNKSSLRTNRVCCSEILFHNIEYSLHYRRTTRIP